MAHDLTKPLHDCLVAARLALARGDAIAASDHLAQCQGVIENAHAQAAGALAVAAASVGGVSDHTAGHVVTVDVAALRPLHAACEELAQETLHELERALRQVGHAGNAGRAYRGRPA